MALFLFGAANITDLSEKQATSKTGNSILQAYVAEKRHRLY